MIAEESAKFGSELVTVKSSLQRLRATGTLDAA
jgi:hypothetical protein